MQLLYRDGFRVVEQTAIRRIQRKQSGEEEAEQSSLSLALLSTCRQLQSEDNNRVAHGLLRLYREWNHLKYYGPLQYWKHRFATATDTSPARTVSLSSKSTTAKVAFMMTAAMKAELEDKGFTKGQIQQLTPAQAHYILRVVDLSHHDTGMQLPTDDDGMQNFILQLQQRIQKEQQQQPFVEEEQLDKIIDTSTRSSDTGTSTSRKKPTTTRLNQQDQGNSMTLIPDNTSDHHQQQGNAVWYEIVQTNATNSQKDTIALYSSQQEALLAQQTYQELEKRRTKTQLFTYEIKIRSS